jgi:hypothetical protein
MKDELNKLHLKIDKVSEEQQETNIHLAEYNTQLGIHLKRSEMLEQELKPVVKHVYMLQGALKLAASAGIIAGLVKLIGVA